MAEAASEPTWDEILSQGSWFRRSDVERLAGVHGPHSVYAGALREALANEALGLTVEFVAYRGRMYTVCRGGSAATTRFVPC